MKRIDWKRYSPVGRGLSQMMQGGIFAAIIAVLWAFFELMKNYLSARDALYEIVPPVKPIFPNRVLIEGAHIAPFSEIIGGSLDFFPLFWLFMGLEVLSAYYYHRKDSMSIYLMRRLPDRWELHRRCWGRPLILTAASLLVMGAILLLYYVIYLVFTPAGCLPY